MTQWCKSRKISYRVEAQSREDNRTCMIANAAHEYLSMVEMLKI